MGRNEDFSQYVASRWQRLVRSAVLLGCSAAEAEDVVQTALMRCLVHWPRVQRGPRCLRPPCAYQHLHLLAAPVLDGGEGGPHGARAAGTRVDRRGGRRRLDPPLRYYVNLDEQQMAIALGVAPGTVKSRLSRALRVLAEDPHLAELRGTP